MLSRGSKIDRKTPAEWAKLSKKEKKNIIRARKNMMASNDKTKSGKLKVVKKQRQTKPAPRAPPDILDIPYEVPLGINIEERSVLNVKTAFVKPALNEAFLTLMAYLGGTGVFSDVKTTGLATPGLTLLNAITYLYIASQDIIRGNAQSVTQIPRVVKDLIVALKPKTVPFHAYNSVSYGWNEFANSVSLIPQAVGDGSYRIAYPALIDDGTYTNALVDYAPLSGTDYAVSYAALLKVIGTQGRNGFLDILSMDTPNIMDKDCSAFARSYRYVGLNGVSTDSYYKDVEGETGITSPLFSSYCNYEVPDVRVPKYLTPYIGGASFSMGLPLSTVFHSHFNKIPTIVKQVDFEEIYTLLTLYMCYLKEKALAFGSTEYEALPFTFSQQDFRIMLRQALLNVYKDTQFFTQFCATIAFDGNTNAFVPFVVSPGLAPRGVFGQLLVPTLIAENLNSLRGRKYKVKGKKSKLNVGSSAPVLGRYYQDEPSVPAILANGSAVNLFAPLVQLNVPLTDLFCVGIPGGAGTVDPNSDYYQGVLEEWNQNVTKLSQFSVETRPIVTDTGPKGCGLLFVSKVQSGDIGGLLQAKRKVRNNPVLSRNCMNIEPIKLERQDSKKKLIVETIPAASVLVLNTTNVLSVIPTTTEINQFYQFMITPVMRENMTEDALTVPMYQTITNEVNSDQVSSVNNVFGTGVYSNLTRYAGACVTGVGKDDNNSYNLMMRRLNELNEGGFLGSLLGAAGSAIGIPSDVSNMIGSLIPF